MNTVVKTCICLALAAIVAGGCSPSDQFWKKPDFGEKVTTLDDATQKADAVRNLDLYSRDLKGFPDAILKLSNLERLGLRKNAIGTLPTGIAGLSKVYWLDLGQAGLTELNTAIGRMPALTTLYLNDNALTALPASMADLSKLAYLNADRNKLTSLPSDLGRLPALKWLRLNGNQLTALPSDLSGWSKSLKRLYLKGNPLSDAEKDRIRKALPECEVFF